MPNLLRVFFLIDRNKSVSVAVAATEPVRIWKVLPILIRIQNNIWNPDSNPDTRFKFGSTVKRKKRTRAQRKIVGNNYTKIVLWYVRVLAKARQLEL